MMRRSQLSLMRRSPVLLAGGELWHPPKLEDVPPSSGTRGFFGPLNGPLAPFRVIDIKWMMNRAVELHREHYIATPTMYLFLWMFCWQGMVMFIYGDGAPPRQVDWNTEEAGFLPQGFEKTPVHKKV